MPNPADFPDTPSTRRQPTPGDVLDGTYRLDQQLGRGGVGVVFKAWHLHLQRPCAVKFLHPQLVSNEELRTRFRREAQSAFQLGHPHIVAITDFRDDPSAWPYIVMELVQGQTLRERLENGALPSALAVRLMAQLCDALMTAHRRGVIHRDIKPWNFPLLDLPKFLRGEFRGNTAQLIPRFSRRVNKKIPDGTFGIGLQVRQIHWDFLAYRRYCALL